MVILALLTLICSVAASRPAAGFEAAEARWATYKTSGLTASGGSSGSDDGLSYTSMVKLATDQKTHLGPSFQQLLVSVRPQTPTRLLLTIAPEGEKRWRVPDSIIPRPAAAKGLTASSLLYEVVEQPLTASGQPFALIVNRKSTGAPVLDTRGHSFLFKDQFIELTTSIPADCDLYGLGERTLSSGLLLPRNGDVFTMWARDSAAGEPDINVYSAHPFLLQVNKDGTALGSLLLNSNGMDVILNKTAVTWRAIGGMVELHLFLGPTPEEVIRQAHELVGRPMMPPFWALGAHQGKWGYSDIAVLEEVVANYSAAGLPLESLWLDIEHMASRFQVFTLDKERYPPARMRAFVDKLHAEGQHWAPIFNPGVAVMPGFKAYEEGNADDIWIRDVTGKPYRGQVWPGSVFFPSYLAAKTHDWLKRQLQAMYDQVPFDGMWLDMSEAANFCSGMVCEAPTSNMTAMWILEMPTPSDYNISHIVEQRTTCQLSCTDAPASNRIAHPPYKIHNFGWRGDAPNNGVRDRARYGDETAPLDLKLISVTARHPDGTLEYDAHNLYGTAMAQAFAKAFRAVSGKRNFQLTRSTAPGASSHTGHWTGDTRVSWQSMREATASILNANIWGLAMTGADICGYGIEGTQHMLVNEAQREELCVRWTSAGAFYPFSRNHMNLWTLPHEPYRWASATAAAKKAYGLRYRLLSYIYASMFLAHKRGGTLARPLLFTDPSDPKARNATSQWMLGEVLLVSPVVSNESNIIAPYFTKGSWYSAWDDQPVAGGRSVTMEVPLGEIAVHLRGGAVVPMQRYAPVTRDVRFSPITLVVTLPSTPIAAKAREDGAAARAPLPPYALEEPCAAAHSRHEGKLVSCGLLFADTDAQEVTDATSTQVWLQAVTEPDGRRGTVSNIVKAADPALKQKLRVTELHVLGLGTPAQQQQQAGSGARAAIMSAWQGRNKQHEQHRGARLAQESNNKAGAAATVVISTRANGSTQSQTVKGTYDAGKGVLRVTGLDLLASEPFTVQWSR